MSGKIPILLVLLLFLPAANSLAAKRGLFLLGDFNQFVVMDYNYSGQQTKNQGGSSGSSSAHAFNESYSAGVPYSILDPRFLTGHVMGQFKLDQGYSSGTSNSGDSTGYGFLYDITGNMFSRKPYPLTFFSRSESNHIQRPFSSAYDLGTNSFGFGGSLLNDYFPVTVSYQRSTSETSGLTDDRKQVSGLLRIQGQHVYANSQSSLQLSHSTNMSELKSGIGTPDENISYELSGTNALTSSDQTKKLNSTVMYREQLHQGTTRNFTLGESYAWQLGNALSFGSDYGFSHSSAETASGTAAGSATEHTGSIHLRHQLFRSLISRLVLRGRQSSQTAGDQTEYGGTIDLAYSKRLAAGSNLKLTYSGSLMITDRNFTVGILQATDEPLTAEIPGNNLLRHPDVIPGIIVRDADNPAILYTENADYLVSHTGTLTNLDFSVTGSLVTNGKKLLISYTYAVDPSVKYETTTHQASGSVDLFDGKYQIFTNVSQSSQDVIASGANARQSSSSRVYSLGASTTLDRMFASVKYEDSDSDQSRHRSIEGDFRNTHYFNENKVQLRARGRYTLFGATSFNSSETSETTASLDADISRRVFSNGTVFFRGGIFHATGTSNNRNDITFEGIYQWAFGRFSLDASALMQFRNTTAYSARNDQFHLRITRKF